MHEINLTLDMKVHSRLFKQLGSKTFIVQHVKKITLTRQVTTDFIIPLVERWNLNK